MKRILLTILALLLVVTVVDARRKRELAGSVKDGWYQDDKYELKMMVSDNWKANVGEADGSTRLILVQKKFAIPARYSDAADYTYIPKVVVWVDTSSLSPSAFMDSLTSGNWKGKQLKVIRADCEILNQKELTPKGRKMKTLAKETSVDWDAEAKYVKDIASSSSSASGVRVNGAYFGKIVVVKHGGMMYLFQLMCESDFTEAVLKEVLPMIESIAFTKATE